MINIDEWSKITCEKREELVHNHTHGKLNIFSTITDPKGLYGSPLVFTEWGIANEDRPVLRDYLTYDCDRRPKECTHYIKEQNQ